MAGEAVDHDYHGRPVRIVSDMEPDVGDLPAMDAFATMLPDGRSVWVTPEGTFRDKDGRPDYGSPVDYQWPTLTDELLAEAERRAQ